MAKKSDSSSEHHVRFNDSTHDIDKDNEIVVEKVDGHIEVHLGFLQLDHKYAIAFPVLKKLLQVDNGNGLTRIEDKVPNIHCKLEKISDASQHIRFDFELIAHKEKVLEESIKFFSGCNKRIIEIVLQAHVLRKGMGTPLLKNGVHSIGVIPNADDSEVSDWHGGDIEDS